MQKSLFLVFLLLITLSCNKSEDGSDTNINADGTSITDWSSYPDFSADGSTTVPTLAYTFNVNITFVNFTPDQEAKMQQAVELIKKLVASEEFKDRVLNHSFNGVKTYVDNNRMTNGQIYQKILNGDESLQPTRDNEMDVEVELYYENTTTVGYTYPSSRRIWVNTKYFNTYSVASVAANLMHEWLHKLGFTHAVSYSLSRDYSVPYGIGSIVRNIGPGYY